MSATQNPFAFPVSPDVWATHPDFHGMTLRDWFAGQAALPAIGIAEQSSKGASPMPTAAKMAYEFADAMLAERAKGGAE